MLSTPQNGWTEIAIGSFSGWGSSIQDVPVVLLESLIRALAYDLPAQVEIDEEGSSFRIHAFHRTTVTRKNEQYSFDIDARALAKELLSDLERDFDAWISWQDEPNRRDHLLRLMDQLRKEVNIREY